MLDEANHIVQRQEGASALSDEFPDAIVEPTEKLEWSYHNRSLHSEMCDRVEANNRRALLAALEKAKIRTMIVKIDHSDETNEVTALDHFAYRGLENEEPVDIPNIPVTIQEIGQRVDLKGGHWFFLDEGTETLEAAIDFVCREYLQDFLDEYWIVKGSGTFLFDTAYKTIKLNLEMTVHEAVEREQAWGPL